MYIKFTDVAIISMENTIPKLVPKSGQCIGSKQGSLWKSQKMDCNSSYRDPIYIMQKPNIKFLYTSTISVKGASPISPFFTIEHQSQILDSM